MQHVGTQAPAFHTEVVQQADGVRVLRRKVRRWKPQIVALVGVTLYRALFKPPAGRIACGLQKERFEGTAVFVLPNPSGRNANFTYAEMLAPYRALKRTLKSEL